MTSISLDYIILTCIIQVSLTKYIKVNIYKAKLPDFIVHSDFHRVAEVYWVLFPRRLPYRSRWLCRCWRPCYLYGKRRCAVWWRRWALGFLEHPVCEGYSSARSRVCVALKSRTPSCLLFHLSGTVFLGGSVFYSRRDDLSNCFWPQFDRRIFLADVRICAYTSGFLMDLEKKHKKRTPSRFT